MSGLDWIILATLLAIGAAAGLLVWAILPDADDIDDWFDL
jgi:hypothetical protein